MITEGLDQAAIPAWAARWSGMRATGVGVKLARRCNSSHRICQFRPHAKLSTSAAKIAKTITNVTVIEYILRARPPACRARGYRILSPGLA